VRPPTLTLGGRPVGDGQPALVVAEVAQAHEGSADTALRMIEAAFKMGADAVSFQVFRTERLVVRRHPDRRNLDEVELGVKDWRRVLGAAKASGLGVMVEAFDPPSLELAAEAEVDAYQVPATDMENPEFIRAVARAGQPVFLTAGGLGEAALREAIDLVGAAPLGLLHGLPSFPVPLEEARLRDLASLKERHRVPVGFRDRTDGGSAFALVAPALAVACGADLVEKHFTLDRTRKGRDYQPSLGPEDFYRMVELLRQAERARGEGPPAEGEETRRSRRNFRRSVVAQGLIARGEVLTAAMLAFKRTDVRFAAGIAPKEADRVIGRRAVRPIQADEVIQEDMLE
jgi:N,N'-diacetyllegionaminate synthase